MSVLKKIPFRFGRSGAPILLSSAVLLSAAGGLSAAELPDPYTTANRNPFVQIYGLPEAESARLVAPGKSRFGLQVDISNDFSVNTKADEGVMIDGETHRAELQWRQGVASGWELGLNLPFLSQRGGGLDSFIENWHDWFGMPDGDRPAYPRNKIRFAYRKSGHQLFVVDQPQEGIGDVSLSAAYQLSDSTTRQWALRGQLKLPTGDADGLLGSGSTDVALALHVSDEGWGSGITLHGSLGAMWMSDGDVLDYVRNDWVAFGSGTLAWRSSERTTLKLQLDVHSAFYDSNLTELGKDSAQLTLGGAVRLSDKWTLDLGLSEDIIVDTAPDVVFVIGIKGGDF